MSWKVVFCLVVSTLTLTALASTVDHIEIIWFIPFGISQIVGRADAVDELKELQNE